jgi:hypothetical protein
MNMIEKRRPLVDIIPVDKETALPGFMAYGVALIEIIEGVALIIGLALAVIYYSKSTRTSFTNGHIRKFSLERNS